MEEISKLGAYVSGELVKQITPNTESMSEIDAMRKDADPRIRETCENAIQTKYLNSDTNLKKAKVLNAIWKSIGATLSTLGNAGKHISGIMSGYTDEQRNRLKNRFVNCNIEIPPISLPTLKSATEGLLYASQDPNLQEMYENLITKLLDKNESSLVHPSYVRIIEQLSSIEAKILKEIIMPYTYRSLYEDISIKEHDKKTVVCRYLINLYQYENGDFSVDNDINTNFFYDENISLYIDNWIRLGLVTVKNEIVESKLYDNFLNNPIFRDITEKYKDKEIVFKKKVIARTDLGIAFSKAVGINVFNAL
ncbi:DUF4393 domain-containing protein [Ursidibacter arcticus]